MLHHLLMLFFNQNKTNYLAGSGTLKINVENDLIINVRDYLRIKIDGELMSITDGLTEWHVGDTVSWSDSVTGLDSDADPTDYTIKFDICPRGTTTAVQTIDGGALDADANYSVPETTLNASVTAGEYDIYASLWWSNDTKYKYEGYFTKEVYPAITPAT